MSLPCEEEYQDPCEEEVQDPCEGEVVNPCEGEVVNPCEGEVVNPAEQQFLDLLNSEQYRINREKALNWDNYGSDFLTFPEDITPESWLSKPKTHRTPRRRVKMAVSNRLQVEGLGRLQAGTVINMTKDQIFNMRKDKLMRPLYHIDAQGNKVWRKCTPLPKSPPYIPRYYDPDAPGPAWSPQTPSNLDDLGIMDLRSPTFAESAGQCMRQAFTRPAPRCDPNARFRTGHTVPRRLDFSDTRQRRNPARYMQKRFSEGMARIRGQRSRNPCEDYPDEAEESLGVFDDFDCAPDEAF